MRFNGTTIPTHRDETYDTSEVSRYKSSSSGDIEVEALNVTENGTYIAPEGKAYSPVNVNVEGGGGSSDFSTAQVTFINTVDRHEAHFHFTFTEAFDSEYATGFYIDSELGVSNMMDEDIVVSPSASFTQEVYIQKDKNILVQPTVDNRSYTISGNVVETTFEDLPLFIITGDCTITIS